MRRNRVALDIGFGLAVATTLAVGGIAYANTITPTREGSWDAHPSQPKTELLSSKSLMPLAIYATAVLDNQAAQAFAAAELASKQAASYSTPRASGRSSASSTQSPVTPGGSSIWSCIISHESGGDPGAVNSSSGAGGLFQFLPSTWQANGGSGLPENASVSEQWAIAEATQARDGWSPWVGDGCTPLG
jgi:hypothetical protein